MAELKDIVAYICRHYPHKDELSKARLTKMVYLSDWKSAIDRGKQITNIQWVFNHYGPYVPDVVEVAQKEKGLFEVNCTFNYYGQPKDVISLVGSLSQENLQDDEKSILDQIIQITANKNWDGFIQLVYSTYPILTQARMSELNLVQLAEEYKGEKRSFVA